MAVSDFNAPNLAPSYGNALDQLKTSADLALKKPTPYEIGTNIANSTDSYLKNKEKEQYEVGKLYLQHQFDTELQRQQQEFQKRGETRIDDETIAHAQQEFGIDISKWKGLSVNPDALEKFIMEKHSYLEDEGNKKKIQAVMNDPKLTPQEKAAKIAGLSSSTKEVTEQAAKSYFEKTKQNKALRYPDPSSSTHFRYAQTVDNAGRAVQSADDLEAPAPSEGKGSGAITSKQAELASVEKFVSDMKSSLDKTPGGMAGKAASVIGKTAGLANKDVNVDPQFYDDNKRALAASLYRLMTGDTRLSDDDASKRAYPMIPGMTESEGTRNKKWDVIQSAIEARKKKLESLQSGGMTDEQIASALNNPAGMAELEAAIKNSSDKTDLTKAAATSTGSALSEAGQAYLQKILAGKPKKK